MGYPRRLLDESEDVVFDLHPHWKVMFRPVLVVVVTIFAGAFISAKIPDGGTQGPARLAVLLVGIAVIGMFAVLPFVRWRTTHFVLTTKRVIMRSGLLARSGRDIPLFRVNDVTFGHSAWERLFGAGTLTVESAGERGQVTLGDIPHVEAVQRELYRLVEMHEARRSGELLQRSQDPSYDTDTASPWYDDSPAPTRELRRHARDDRGEGR
jgi:uncharacterized membrane protein YdbT with pleckstrin-like domain